MQHPNSASTCHDQFAQPRTLQEAFTLSERTPHFNFGGPKLVGATTAPGRAIPLGETAIRNALLGDRITIALQPYRSLNKDLRIKDPVLTDLEGVEALVRLKSESGRIIGAGSIIQSAESIPGLSSELDLAVLRKSMSLARIINEARTEIGIPKIRIAFNCSLDLIEKEDFALLTMDAIEDAGAKPNDCSLEILEQISDLTQAQAIQLKELQDSGIHISLDDFDKRFGGGRDTDPVLKKLLKIGARINSLKVDGRTTSQITKPEGFGHSVRLIGLAIRHEIEQIVFEGGYDNFNAQGISVLRRLAHCSNIEDRIKVLAEGYQV